MWADITVLVLTRDESPNIARTLAALGNAAEIVVVDSGSSDDTVAIAQRFARTRVVTRDFDSHAQQWNFGLVETAIRTPWVLALDADHVLTPELVREIDVLEPMDQVAGYRAAFEYAISGKRVRASVYPPRVVLFRRERGHFVQDGHTQRLVLDGSERSLAGHIVHDDRKPFRTWLSSQRRYAALEAARLRAIPWADASSRDRVRKLMVAAPLLVPLYVLLVRPGILDGLVGLRYAFERGLAELMIAFALLRSHLGLRART